MIKFQNKNWQLSVTRNMSLFQSCLDVGGHFLYSQKYGLPPLEHLFIVKNGSVMFAHSNKNNIAKYNKAIEKICLNPSKLKKLEKTYHKYGKNLLQASEKLEKNTGARNYKNYISANLHLAAGLYLTTAIGLRIYFLLSERLKKLFPLLSAENLDILIADITYPPKSTPLIKSRLDLLSLCLALQKKKIKPNQIKKFPKLYKKFENYCEKHSFIPVNYNEDPWSEKEIFNQLESIYKINCQKEKKLITKTQREKIKIAKRKLKEIGDREIKNMAIALQTGTFLNEYRKNIFCRASLAYRLLFKEIAGRFKLKNWQECWKLTPDEIYDLYFKNNTKIIKIIPQRNWAGIIFSGTGYRVLKMKNIQPFVRQINKTSSKDKASVSKEIKGVVANPGFVRGVTRVILGKNDFYKFKDDDIIVTVMTSVEFVPLMERASAFVTNEGGITSHASIVSRELNKPCIIGTKIATQVLKDGDLVEVDANKGIVKIIKRSK